MNGIHGIIFDCDGVLFESRRANLAYYNAVLEQFGEKPVTDDDPDRVHLCHTAASPQVLACLLGVERATEALAFAAELDYRQFIPYMTPEPGMQDALACLAERYPLALATNRGHSILSILEHFDLVSFFQAVVTSKDVQLPKPAPDMLQEAARRLKSAPSQLLFVGDSELDQAAARSAGMPFAIYRGNLKAELTLGHHGELVKILMGSWAWGA